MKIEVKVLGRKGHPGLRRNWGVRDVVMGARDIVLQSRLTDLLAQWRRNVVRAIPFTPAVDAIETADAYLLTCDMPGVRQGEMEARVSEGQLVVSGKRTAAKVAESDSYCFAERAYGPFERVFELPQGIDSDHIQADLKDGVLTIRLPKVVEPALRKIPVQRVTEPSAPKA
ncbi:MAG TPA: Hsp20/alpha crystallin family protein [Myxococcales bacterium]